VLLRPSALAFSRLQCPARKALNVSRKPRQCSTKPKYTNLYIAAKTAELRLLIPLSVRAPDVEFEFSMCF
jgi:hypothetical protein